jgi:hypothetical protein
MLCHGSARARAIHGPELEEVQMTNLNEPGDDPVGRIDLTDLELESTSGGTTWVCLTITLTVSVCSPGSTACGSCQYGTRGCC